MTEVPDSLDASDVFSIRELAGRRSGAAQLGAFTAHAREIGAMSHLELLQEFDHQDDPLMLWVVHREADARGIPPALRWGVFTCMPLVAMSASECDIPAGAGGCARQIVFINWLADMLWLTPRDRLRRRVGAAGPSMFEHVPNSAEWHAQALETFAAAEEHPESFARRMGLSEKSRLATLTLATPAMLEDRSSLLDLTELTDRIAAYAASRPDRSGVFTPAQVVDRRLMAHRLFVLAGRQQGLGAQYLSLVTGQPVSRQAFTRQLDALASSSRPATGSGSHLSA